MDATTIKVGETYAYYPRSGKPGHAVTVTQVRRHPFHGTIVRFRYERDGREREVTYQRFHTTDN